MFDGVDSQSNWLLLSHMLSKATMRKGNQDSYYNLISQLFGASENFNPPIAAIKQINSSVDGSLGGWWCCATPAIITPNRDHLDLVQIAGFGITEKEAKSFCDEFNDYFKGDGLRFSFVTPDKWYCCLVDKNEQGFQVSNASPFDIDGEDIAPYIPKGKSGSQWRKIFNEMQMLLHHSVTNHKRSQAGKPEINSVWYWGGGALTESDRSLFNGSSTTVFGNDQYCIGLGQLGSAKVSALSESISVTNVSKNNLIVLNLDSVNWHEWDEKYFTPAVNLLKNGDTDAISFYLDLHNIFYLTRMDLYKFWKGEKSISQFSNV